ncbi:MAG: hypothetical protein EAX89_06215 [Candidatus Lokiarchaeota archaeon]|nr:hypothetical protein [Candidatus Lokiarchaeota archaeon]
MGNTFGIIGLILAIVALCVSWIIPIPFSVWIFPILAIVISAIGIAKDDKNGMAIAGLVIGIIALVCWGFLGFIILAFFLGFLGLSGLF